MKKTGLGLTLLFFTLLAGGCAPEPGTPEWCETMKKKPQGEWTVDEVKTYTTDCIF